MERERTPVTRLMTTGVLTVRGDETVAAAAQTLLDEGVGSLVVVDEEGTPVGMFTTTDLAEIVAGDVSGSDATVSEYMTGDVVTIDAHGGIRDAAAKMIRNGIHHLPVTDDEGAIVGILSTKDVTAYFSYTGGTDVV